MTPIFAFIIKFAGHAQPTTAGLRRANYEFVRNILVLRAKAVQKFMVMKFEVFEGETYALMAVIVL